MRHCLAVVILLKNNHPGAALSNLAVAHHEHLGHGHAHPSASGALRRAGELCHDDVALLDHAHDLQLGRVDELGRAVDGLVVGFFAGQTKGAEDGPLNVVGQAGQDLLVIILAEAVQVGVDGFSYCFCDLCLFHFPVGGQGPFQERQSFLFVSVNQIIQATNTRNAMSVIIRGEIFMRIVSCDPCSASRPGTLS